VCRLFNGEADHKDYILETVRLRLRLSSTTTMTAGWHIFLLSGSPSMGGSAVPARPTAVYRNNRDGTFSERLPEKSGLRFTGWGFSVCVGDYNNEGGKTCSARSTDK